MERAEDDSVHLPKLRMDQLLEELQARLDAARGTRDRVHSLLEAVVSVGRELDLDQVLWRIVKAATVLVDAQYGALGVIGPDGQKISQFLTVGLTDEQIAAIGPYPSGHGILGELIDNPEPLRLTKISEHSSSYGFPPNHPPMNTFVGVPIRVRDIVFGNLYLTEKRGGVDFDAEDEAVLSTLAVAAGVAIDNARLYEESRQREQWLQASAEVTNALMSGLSRTEALRLIAERAKDITSAALAVIALPIADTPALAVELAVGEHEAEHHGLVLPLDASLIGAAFHESAPVTSSHISSDPRVHADPPRLAGMGPAVAVPIGTGESVRGVLLLVRGAGAPTFSGAETDPLSGFAGQAAVAMELAERRSDAEQIARLEDRDRIARDLHDLAIQRLFATGMTLQSTGRFIEHAEASERVLRAVDDLDETIKIIRSTIFGLRLRGDESGQSLRADIVRTVGEATPVLGFAPSLRMDGLLDTQVPRETGEHLVAVLREALSNTARHGHAERATVTVQAEDNEVVLTVTDDGVGLPEKQQRRSGLGNLAERAEQLGGRLELLHPEGGGTTLRWRVPMSAAQR